jgi:hypothetical protein
VSLAWLMAISIAAAPAAYAANPVNYSLSPALGSVQPGGTLNLQLTVNTSVVLAGGSVHVTYKNSSYTSFATASSPALSFVDYHADYADVLFICNNNHCDPGKYPIATIAVKAGTSGTVQVTFVPKETAGPQDQAGNFPMYAADGVSGLYSVSSSAQPSPSPAGTGSGSGSGGSTYTVPKDNGSGGTIPQTVTENQKTQQSNKAQSTLASGGTQWTQKKLVLLGAGVGVASSLGLFLLIFLVRRRGRGGGGGFDAGGPVDPDIPVFHG